MSENHLTARRALTFRCERCGRVAEIRHVVGPDPRDLCRACAEVMRERRARLLAHMNDETLYPVPDDGDDDQGWYGTIPHV